MIVKIDIPDNINLMAKAEQLQKSNGPGKLNLEELFLERLIISYKEDKELQKFVQEMLKTMEKK